MAVVGSDIWSQELQVHWPQSWKFVTNRDVLLERFAPTIFNVTDDAIFIRFGEDQDLRVSQLGMHIRILSHDSMDERIAEVLDRVLRIVEPARLESLDAFFSHVRPFDMDYGEARRQLSRVFYGSWIEQRPVRDFALYWDEEVSPDLAAHFQFGVVDEDELIERVADASGTKRDVLRRRTPAWMKVRMPRVALFMKSSYSSRQGISVDVGRVQVPQAWRQWRERSDQLFSSLSELAAPVQRGKVL